MSWDRLFDEPIVLPSGKVLRTLRDAGEYVASLPAETHDQPKWQTAMSALLAVAETGPAMFARIAMMQAIMPKVEPVYDPARKTNWRTAMRAPRRSA